MYQHEKTSQNLTALSGADGFRDNPAALFQREMERACPNMNSLPFFREEIPCYCPPFVLLDNQWIGTALTPWMLSLVILPGPNQEWEARSVGDKLGVALPYKTLMFTVSQLQQIPYYLSHSLASPLDRNLTAQQAVQLADDCLKMALSFPLNLTPPDLNRRNILRAMVK
ncbi:hydrogenase-2 assembly chaperone [Bisgaard Taxon 10/6]|uniref:hydrogenase-2 assembly chaperone n=1 Tax=Exercitatus varius TaxID=67857 RepID=UPI00294B08B3|nr:hydrogenase-2 assembly chaperone [Exercitatus varius]MDG2953434.1 hydrogenase-2 assembly chaperone [Exercitatus varius]